MPMSSFVSPQPNNNSPPLNLSLSFLPARNPQIRAVLQLSTQQWKGLPIPKTRYCHDTVQDDYGNIAQG
ncbi:F-box protein [Cucumis melo var. makuwa]|uniref:F-box protein n=1 Tax=Cucumis melo var. makuwa TaxID=1194695 RepID=A0A5D3C671_CUCMM|nr:F-box protein [Cucumis melo var. makuwa]